MPTYNFIDLNKDLDSFPVSYEILPDPDDGARGYGVGVTEGKSVSFLRSYEDISYFQHDGEVIEFHTNPAWNMRGRIFDFVPTSGTIAFVVLAEALEIYHVTFDPFAVTRQELSLDLLWLNTSTAVLSRHQPAYKNHVVTMPDGTFALAWGIAYDGEWRDDDDRWQELDNTLLPNGYYYCRFVLDTDGKTILGAGSQIRADSIPYPTDQPGKE